MEGLRTFTQWLHFVNFPCDYFNEVEKELDSLELALSLLQSGKLTMLGYMYIYNLKRQNLPDDKIKKSIYLLVKATDDTYKK